MATLAERIVDFYRHVIVAAVTGCGKTTLLQNVIQLILEKHPESKFYLSSSKASPWLGLEQQYGEDGLPRCVNVWTDKPETIEKLIQRLEFVVAELNRRGKKRLIAEMKGEEVEASDPIYVVLDELPTTVGIAKSHDSKAFEKLSRLIKAIINTGREDRVFAVLITQGHQCGTIGLDKDVRRNLGVVCLGGGKTKDYKTLTAAIADADFIESKRDRAMLDDQFKLAVKDCNGIRLYLTDIGGYQIAETEMMANPGQLFESDPEFDINELFGDSDEQEDASSTEDDEIPAPKKRRRKSDDSEESRQPSDTKRKRRRKSTENNEKAEEPTTTTAKRRRRKSKEQTSETETTEAVSIPVGVAIDDSAGGDVVPGSSNSVVRRKPTEQDYENIERLDTGETVTEAWLKVKKRELLLKEEELKLKINDSFNKNLSAETKWNLITLGYGLLFGTFYAFSPLTIALQSTYKTAVQVKQTSQKIVKAGDNTVKAVGEFFAADFRRQPKLNEKVNGHRVSSLFNKTRKHPVTGVVLPHNGHDVATPTGTPLYIVGEAGKEVTVKCSFQKGGAGLWGEYNNGHRRVRAFHLDKCQDGKFQSGQIWARTGGAKGDPKAGTSTGPHLHLETWQGNTAVPPNLGYLWASLNGNMSTLGGNVAKARKETSQAIAQQSSKKLSNEELNYFLEIAFGAEYSGVNAIRKWNTRNLKIRVHGEPTREDSNVLNRVITELSQLTGLSIEIVGKDTKPNINFYFVSPDRFKAIEPNVRPGNDGYAWTYGTKEIEKATILISSKTANQQFRSHLIREELTQALGLLKDSLKHKDSIFYGRWSTIQQFSELDKVLIQALYSPAIESGFSADQVKQIFSKPS